DWSSSSLPSSSRGCSLSCSVMKVVLPDNSELELPDGATGLDAARAIGPKLADDAVLVRSNGRVQDLRIPLKAARPIQILTTRDKDDPDALAVLRHPSAHLLAEAVRRLYPGVKVAIGPAIENGFYYDFEFPEPIGEEDLPRIEEEIRRELEEGREWTREEVSADEARKRFEAEGEPYKADLDAYLERLEEARRRDHRKLGQQLDLFHLAENSPGSPFWHPKGMVIWNELEDLRRRENAKRGYVEVKTPLLYDVDTYITSGHYENYEENMFFVKGHGDEKLMALKPMNCPGHMLLFGSRRRSYRELPLRYAESSTLHRDERGGTLHGLLRVRHVTQDDAHVFVAEEQIQEEIHGMVEYARYLYDLFGSLERFTGILIEHYAGAFPFWLAPVQIRIIPVGEDHREAVGALKERLRGYRVEVDERDETVGKRIRDAELEKIPYVIVYGDKESDESLAVRKRGGEQSTLSLDRLRAEISEVATL